MQFRKIWQHLKISPSKRKKAAEQNCFRRNNCFAMVRGDVTYREYMKKLKEPKLLNAG